MKRPTTSNADEWVLWLEEWRDAGAPFLAVQIVEAIEEHQRALARQVYALAEATQDECHGKDEAYHRGRRHEAKGIARAIGGIMPLCRDPSSLDGIRCQKCDSAIRGLISFGEIMICFDCANEGAYEDLRASGGIVGAP